MSEQQIWKKMREEARSDIPVKKTGALNAALLFGLAGLAFAMIVTPMVSGPKGDSLFADAAMPEFDNIVTGSVKKSDGPRQYVIRRSILQDMPDTVCIIDDDGAQSGC